MNRPPLKVTYAVPEPAAIILLLVGLPSIRRSKNTEALMLAILKGIITVVGRILLCAIFFMTAVGQYIPHFNVVADRIDAAGMPQPKVGLVVAIAFLIIGSLSVLVGYKARIGAALLLIFLGLEAYCFHSFWVADADHRPTQEVQFMKNVALAGAMLMIIANGPGPFSVDCWQARKKAEEQAASRAPARIETSATGELRKDKPLQTANRPTEQSPSTVAIQAPLSFQTPRTDRPAIDPQKPAPPKFPA
jgi:putative oxidoreductase